MTRAFVRYLLVQVAAYAIDMGVFVLAGWWGMPPVPANIPAKILAGVFAFIAHRRITFRVHGQRGGTAQLLRYALLLAINVPLASTLLALLLPHVSPAPLAKFVADALCVLVNFLASHYLVFRPRAGTPG